MTGQNISQQRSLDQKRAAAAWEAIKEIRDRGSESLEKKYKPLAGSGAMDVQTSGLGQTLAFWRAKASKREEHEAIYRHTSDWIKQQIPEIGQVDLLGWLIKTATTDQYRRATVEGQAFLTWLKRFAEAELKGELHGKED